MVFLLRLIKALRVKGKLKKYIEAKQMSRGEDMKKKDIFARFNMWCLRTFPSWLGGYRGSEQPDELNYMEKLKIKLGTFGTYENYVLKSVVGFISGVILTYIFFFFFVFQLNFSLKAATSMCSILGIILTLGLAFSYKVRCLVLLLLPQFFSKKGRTALIAYAFILVFTGPAKNTLRNLKVLSETMACGQAKLKAAVKSLIDLIKKPFYALKDSIQKIIEKVKMVVQKVKEMIMAIKRTIEVILGVIKNAYNWLNSFISICSKEVGTPYERCVVAFESSIEDCKAKLGSTLDWACSIAYAVSHVCYAVKPIDYVCEMIEFVSDELVKRVKKKFQEFSYQIRNIFYVSIDFSHSFGLETEQSKSYKDIAAGMAMEIRNKTDKLFSLFDWMSFAFSFFFLFLLWKVMIYKHKYLTNDRFDNHYITENIVHLDIRRTYLGKETILPLNSRERKKYVPISSVRLVYSEKKTMAKSAIFLSLSTIKLSIHIITDYSLYWILKMIRKHAQFQTYIDAPNSVEIRVEGKSLLSDLYASVINAFQPSGLAFDADTAPCLPDPIPPDTSRYKQIISLIAIAWVFSFLEPYGLRLRNVVMAYYYPARARVRAVWLYNNIIRSRGGFLKFARRQLRRQFSKREEGVEKVTLMDRLRAQFPLLNKIWGGKKVEGCLLCGSIGTEKAPLIKCPRPGCIGVYCVDCFAQIQNLCTICLLPIEYGDLSDISEERDSSDVEKIKAARAPEGETTDDNDTSTGLIIEDTDTELSYDYQDKERDIDDRPPNIIDISGKKDLEAQKPIERVTIEDFGYPVKESFEPEKHSFTLAEKKKSGIWGLFPDHEEDISSSPVEGSENQRGPLQKKTSLRLRKEKHDLGRKYKEISSESSDEPQMPPEINLLSPQKARLREMKKYLKFPNFRRRRVIKKSTRAIDQDAETSSAGEDSHLITSKIKTPPVKWFKRPHFKTTVKESKPSEGKRITQLKEQLFGDKEPTVNFLRGSSGYEFAIPGKIKPAKVTSMEVREKKRTQLINWLETGTYQSGELVAKTSFSNMVRDLGVGVKNLFSRYMTKEGKPDASDIEMQIPLIEQEHTQTMATYEEQKLKFREIKGSQETRLQGKERTDTVLTKVLERIKYSQTTVSYKLSPTSSAPVSFRSMKSGPSPAKIVHEMFKVEFDDKTTNV